jgi:predicted nucleotidyltransferase component of viral defense system
MKISLQRLSAEAEATGFRPDMLEKVAHLLNLLDAIRSHPFLKGKLVLKGGTALNLFVFDVPRLSVDIDLNYVGAEDRENMLAERPKIDKAIQAVFSREGFAVRRRRQEEPGRLGRRLIEECRQSLLTILPFSKEETEFLNRLLDEGEISPSLLTDDIGLQDRIRRHPLLAWKALKVRQYRDRS